MKWIFKITSISLVSFFWITTGAAAQTTDGNRLHLLCNENTSRIAYGFCAGYMTGLRNGFEYGILLGEIQTEQGLDKQVCIPSNVTGKQLLDTFKKYLLDNPADRHKEGFVLFYEMAKEAFACN